MPRGYFAPAEEAPHAGTWMSWPSTPSIYGGATAYYESVQETIGRLAAAIAEHEPVTMLVGAASRALAARLCGPKVGLLEVATDDMWARDSGPVFLRNGAGRIAVLDFNFNGWGGKQAHGIGRAVVHHRIRTPRSQVRAFRSTPSAHATKRRPHGQQHRSTTRGRLGLTARCLAPQASPTIRNEPEPSTTDQGTG